MENDEQGAMLKGSCLCGAVRYELRGDPMMMYYCDALPQAPGSFS